MHITRPKYHEKQSGSLCAIHTANNLLGINVYQKEHFDKIADSFPLGTHRTKWSGDYSCDTLIKALQFAKLTMEYVKLSEDIEKEIRKLNLDDIFGFIVNTGDHWLALKKDNDLFWNMDSMKDDPELIGDNDDLVNVILNTDFVKHKWTLFSVI